MPPPKYANFESTSVALSYKNGLKNIIFRVPFQTAALSTSHSHLARRSQLSYNLNRIFFSGAQVHRVPPSNYTNLESKFVAFSYKNGSENIIFRVPFQKAFLSAASGTMARNIENIEIRYDIIFLEVKSTKCPLQNLQILNLRWLPIRLKMV